MSAAQRGINAVQILLRAVRAAGVPPQCRGRAAGVPQKWPMRAVVPVSIETARGTGMRSA